jgi:DNA polymerase III epsilon subunit-like protein
MPRILHQANKQTSKQAYKMTSRSIPVPIRRRYYLVYDTETTGLFPKSTRGGPSPPIEAFPHILQFSFVVYDLFTRQIMSSYDSYVKVADTVEISEEITGITGITREKCNGGANIVDVLESFYKAYIMCEGLVAHNIEFDEKMVMIELERNREQIMDKAPYCFTLFNPIYEKVHNMERFCTMKKGTDICNILVESKTPGRPPSKKWPRLNELHASLFAGEVPDGLHNSMVDVLACLRCYLKMRHGIDSGALTV